MARGKSIVFGLLAVVCPVLSGEGLREKWNPFLSQSVKGFLNLSLSPNIIPPHGDFLLHLGAVDLRQEAGTPVYSVRKGIPSWPKMREGIPKLEGWTTTIQVLSDDGILTYFMHLDPESIPKSLLADMEAKRSIEAGTLLGTLYKHKHMDSHVHFGAADCRKHVRINPQAFVEYKDKLPPTISALTVHRAKDRTDLTGTLSGDVELTVYAHDSIDELAADFPLHKLDLEIDSKAKGSVFSSTVFDASTLPASPAKGDDTCQDFADYDGYNTALGRVIYRWRAVGDQNLSGQPMALTVDKEKIPVGLRGWFQPFPGAWKTADYPNGEYTLRVKAYDAKGNSRVLERGVKIEN